MAMSMALFIQWCECKTERYFHSNEKKNFHFFFFYFYSFSIFAIPYIPHSLYSSFSNTNKSSHIQINVCIWTYNGTGTHNTHITHTWVTARGDWMKKKRKEKKREKNLHIWKFLSVIEWVGGLGWVDLVGWFVYYKGYTMDQTNVFILLLFILFFLLWCSLSLFLSLLLISSSRDIMYNGDEGGGRDLKDKKKKMNKKNVSIYDYFHSSPLKISLCLSLFHSLITRLILRFPSSFFNLFNHPRTIKYMWKCLYMWKTISIYYPFFYLSNTGGVLMVWSSTDEKLFGMNSLKNSFYSPFPINKSNPLTSKSNQKNKNDNSI